MGPPDEPTGNALLESIRLWRIRGRARAGTGVAEEAERARIWACCPDCEDIINGLTRRKNQYSAN